jgi:hypothetical protein
MKKLRDRRRGTVCLRAGLGVLAIVAFLVADTAQASMQKIPLEQLIRSAQLIAVGNVLDARSELVDGGARIETLVTVDVFDYLKGKHLGPLTVRVGGGQVDGLVISQEDEPSLVPGSTVVLFLEPQDKEFVVTGAFQGNLQLLGDAVYRNGESLGTLDELRQRVAGVLEPKEKP